jgi:hypothetical protein
MTVAAATDRLLARNPSGRTIPAGGTRSGAMEPARQVGVERLERRRRRVPGPVLTGLAAVVAVDALIIAAEAFFH